MNWEEAVRGIWSIGVEATEPALFSPICTRNLTLPCVCLRGKLLFYNK